MIDRSGYGAVRVVQGELDDGHSSCCRNRRGGGAVGIVRARAVGEARYQEAKQAGAAGDRGDREGRGRRNGRPAGADRHPDDNHAVFPQVAGSAHVRAVRDRRQGRSAGRRCPLRAGGEPRRQARPQGQEGRVPVGRHPFRLRRAARQRQAQPRVHGRARHLRRVPRHQGAAARKGAQDPGRQDGRAEAVGNRSRLPERRDEHQLAAHHRQGEPADRPDQPPTSPASGRSCSAPRS